METILLKDLQLLPQLFFGNVITQTYITLKNLQIISNFN